ncbi:hypothetical protein TIFTF001_053584 [Ficus carica]|uniref:Uncharacterized protein n=1 Tax=Ficus carica TaxID=3494 RepID=A0AA88ED62_FICCA|nr:hypothetical protein TIFTF001_053584 [Ficus carica]
MFVGVISPAIETIQIGVSQCEREPPTSRARRRRGWRLETSGRATREIGLVATLPSGRFVDRPSPAMASVEPPARRSSRIYFGFFFFSLAQEPEVGHC